jgi:oligoribonuclease NrnB/cAMP/cGMP phosphodiesterase (DHH superfamily)
MKYYVLYHGDCRDGFGAAYAIWKKLKDQSVTYIPCHHGSPLPEITIDKDTTIYVVDFSFDRDVLIQWNKEAAQVLVIDHHITARENLENLSFAKFDLDHSGAILVWKHFHGEKTSPPEFLKHIEDMDLWTFGMKGTKRICAAINSYPQDFEIWDTFASAEGLERLHREGAVIHRFVEQQVKQLCKEATSIDFEDYKNIPAVNSSLFVSETCAELLKIYPDAPFSAAFFQVEKDRRVFSLRSRKGGTDVAELAKKFGGGGHPSASGFSITIPSNNSDPE